MGEHDDLKGQLGRLFRTALSGARDVADEVRRSAHRIREQLDDHPFQQEKRELFAKLGEETYEFYKRGREQVPRILKDSIERLDHLTGDRIGPDGLRIAGDVVDEVVRGVVDGINDFCEETIRARHAEGEGVKAPCGPVSDTRASSSAPSGKTSPSAAKKAPAPRAKAGTAAPKKAVQTKGAKAKPSRTSGGSRRAGRGPVLANDPLAALVRKPEENKG